MWSGANPHADSMQFYLFYRYYISDELCIKLGRGQGDGDIGTRVWALVTRGRETRDLGTSSMGRGDVGRQIQGRGERGDFNEYCKNRR